jgi:fatty acid desaturase
MGLSILKIRTFLEHQAHERARGRTVIIEDRGILAFLFLNNNLHVVHHMHPRMPWYRLPGLYQENRARYLGRNGGYRYGSYGEIFRRYFLKAKDPVPHPLWHSPE